MVALMVDVVDFVVDWLENVLLMQVSAKKSQIIAGRPSVAKAIALGIASKKLSAAAHAKLLGTDFNGGRSRSAVNFCARIAEFEGRKSRFNFLSFAFIGPASF